MCWSPRKGSAQELVPFTRPGVLMVCHVGVRAWFKVIAPFQSAAVMQLLTPRPCFFHVLLLLSSLLRHRKHLLAGKTKPVRRSGHSQGELPSLAQTFPAGGCARVREEARTCLRGHRRAICPSVGHLSVSTSRSAPLFTPATAVRSSPVAVLVQPPAPICDVDEVLTMLPGKQR